MSGSRLAGFALGRDDEWRELRAPPHPSRHPGRVSDPGSSHGLGPRLLLDARVFALSLTALRASPKHNSEKNAAYPLNFRRRG